MIAFICNKDLTRTYAAIARHFVAKGEDIVWLSPSTRWTQWLVKNGFDRATILNMPDFQVDWSRPLGPKEREALSAFETDPTVNGYHVVRMCRGLSRRDPELGLAYVHAVTQRVSEFLSEKQVEVVFGEGTWGFELAIWLVGRKLGIPVVTSVTTRIPTDRFCMVDSIHGNIHVTRKASAAVLDEATIFYDGWLQRPRQPSYAAVNSGYRSFEQRWLKELWQIVANPGLDRGDETLWTLSERIKDRARRAIYARYAVRLLRGRPQPDEPYLLFCLQHQPEAAVDVYGGFHSDQMAVIERLARRLPATHRLWVREHRAALGDRGPSWYKKLNAIPGVRLVDPYADIFSVIRNSSAVVTISGTVGYEAALLGVPALSLSNMFFGEMLSLKADRLSDILNWPMEELLAPEGRASFACSRERAVASIATIFANSWVGQPDDLTIGESISALDDMVMAREANGFMEFLQGVREATHA